MGQYDLTPLAVKHVRQIGRDGVAKWGEARAFRYLQDIYVAFQHIADHHEALPKRTRLTGTSRLRLHRTGSHYIVFAVLTQSHVAVAGVLHERMDVSTRLREMQVHTDRQVGDIRASLLRSQFKSD